MCSIGQLGLTDPSYYYYLNQSGTYSVDGTDDVKEYEETRVSDCCMFVVSVQPFPSGQICSCTCKTIYVACFLIRIVEVKNVFKVIQHHPTTAGSKKHTEGWCWAMIVGACKSLDGVSLPSNLLHGKV